MESKFHWLFWVFFSFLINAQNYTNPPAPTYPSFPAILDNDTRDDIRNLTRVMQQSNLLARDAINLISRIQHETVPQFIGIIEDLEVQARRAIDLYERMITLQNIVAAVAALTATSVSVGFVCVYLGRYLVRKCAHACCDPENNPA